MQRRVFLQSLLATAVLDPDRLLWVPGKKTIFIPPPMEEGISLAMIRSFDMEYTKRITRWDRDMLWVCEILSTVGPSF